MLNRKTDSEAEAAPKRDGESPASAAFGRFEKRRSDIIAAAIPVLNAQGFKGMRLTAVAELIGLKADCNAPGSQPPDPVGGLGIADVIRGGRAAREFGPTEAA